MKYRVKAKNSLKYKKFKHTKMVKKWRKTKNIFFTSISPKTFHFDQKISYFYQPTKAGRGVELGEEYQTGPLKMALIDHRRGQKCTIWWRDGA